MGQSFTILEKNPLSLSIEVDSSIQIEISTGFQNSAGTGHFSAALELETIHELGRVINELNKVYEQLQEAWRCPVCLAYNPKTVRECECGTTWRCPVCLAYNPITKPKCEHEAAE